MDPDTFSFYFYNMNLNTHAVEKISAYFYMAHPYDCNSLSMTHPRGGWTGGHVHSLTNHHNVSTFALRNKNKAKEIKL
jgi:hypothetical protein